MSNIKTLLLYTRGTHQRGYRIKTKSITHKINKYEPGNSAILDLNLMKVTDCPSFTIPNDKLATAPQDAIFLFKNEEYNDKTSETYIYDVNTKKLHSTKSLFIVHISDGYYVYEPITESKYAKTYLCSG